MGVLGPSVLWEADAQGGFCHGEVPKAGFLRMKSLEQPDVNNHIRKVRNTTFYRKEISEEEKMSFLYCPTRKGTWTSRVPTWSLSMRPSSVKSIHDKQLLLPSTPLETFWQNDALLLGFAGAIFFKEIVCKSLSLEARGLNLCS